MLRNITVCLLPQESRSRRRQVRRQRWHLFLWAPTPPDQNLPRHNKDVLAFSKLGELLDFIAASSTSTAAQHVSVNRQTAGMSPAEWERTTVVCRTAGAPASLSSNPMHSNSRASAINCLARRVAGELREKRTKP